MPDPNPLRSTAAAGRAAFGLWATIASPLCAELGAAAGYDYVCIDEQHGAVDAGELMAMLQAAHGGGSAPVVRVAQNEPWMISRALDLGALGVIVPMVDDPAAAERAVAACRYPPAGRRSFGPLRAQLAVGSSRPADLGAHPVCLAMIETRAGLEHLDAIAATPGLDGLYVGPSDLALALGLDPPARLEDPGLLEIIEEVRQTCERHGLIAGVHCLDGADAARLAAGGFALVTVGVDLLLLRAAMARELRRARDAAPAALAARGADGSGA